MYIKAGLGPVLILIVAVLDFLNNYFYLFLSLILNTFSVFAFSYNTDFKIVFIGYYRLIPVTDL